MSRILDVLEEIGMIPFVKIMSPYESEKIGKILLRDSVPVIGVDFCSVTSVDAVTHLHKNVPDLLVGAVSVEGVDQTIQAIDSGAEFVLFSDFDEHAIAVCEKNGVLAVPFCKTPAQIRQAQILGLTAICNDFIGQEVVDACNGVTKIFLTGETDLEKIGSLLNNTTCPTLAACGLIISQEKLQTNGIKDIMYQIFKFSFAHMGINCDNKDEARELINGICRTFSLAFGEITTSYFADFRIEASKWHLPGEKGHFAISTNSVFRAVRFLKGLGNEFLDDTKVYDNHGNLKGIFMAHQFGGFAVQICHN